GRTIAARSNVRSRSPFDGGPKHHCDHQLSLVVPLVFVGRSRHVSRHGPAAERRPVWLLVSAGSTDSAIKGPGGLESLELAQNLDRAPTHSQKISPLTKSVKSGC